MQHNRAACDDLQLRVAHSHRRGPDPLACGAQLGTLLADLIDIVAYDEDDVADAGVARVALELR